MANLLSQFYKQPLVRLLTILILYSVVLSVSFWLAYQLRFDFFSTTNLAESIYKDQIWKVLPWLLPVKLLILYFYRQYSGLLSYFSIPDIFRLSAAITTASILLSILRFTFDFGKDFTPPRGVILIDYVLSLGLIASLRFSFRYIRERFFVSKSGEKTTARKIGIIGVGDTGAHLIKDLFLKRGLGMAPVAAYDDDSSKWGNRIHDVPVIGPPEKLLDTRNELNLEKVILALPNASAKRIGEIVKILNDIHLPFATVPSIDQLTTGQVKVSQIRPVQIEDLLKRPVIGLEKNTIYTTVSEKVCLVTGAGGSIGSEICRQIMTYNPHRLILIEQSEVQMFQIEQELLEKGHGSLITPVICDVLDAKRIESVFKKYEPQIVFHAAAHKHVPLMERQPSEAIKNNSKVTALLAKTALNFEVERFVFISTDKAINPTNVMGASKRLAEIYIQALSNENPGKTKFMAVRFGNVLGSSGSVIPTFKKQIETGGPVKVTHPEVTRYFMTIPEAVSLVLQSGAIGEGGEIFVLDMGEPVKIVELARKLIELSGLRPDEDIEIEFVGLRPGEKLFEELQHHGEDMEDTEHSKIMKFVCEPKTIAEVEEIYSTFTEDIDDLEPNTIKELLRKAVPEYKPYLN